MIRTILIALCLLFIGPGSNACDCKQILSAANADLVFTGTVLKVDRIADGLIHYRVMFKVGSDDPTNVAPSTVTIFEESLQVGGCGIDFQVGKEYAVVAWKEQGIFWTGLCTETKMLE